MPWAEVKMDNSRIKERKEEKRERERGRRRRRRRKLNRKIRRAAKSDHIEIELWDGAVKNCEAGSDLITYKSGINQQLQASSRYHLADLMQHEAVCADLNLQERG